jgi:GT2 family glycosyltransferase
MHGIDFITVSRNPERVASLQRSISLAVADLIPSQLTVIDGNQHDLFTGYNAGIAQTSAEVLVFVHDDVTLMCNALALGRPLQMLLQDKYCGFIGAVGARVVDSTGTWWGEDKPQQEAIRVSRGMVLQRGNNEFGIRAYVWPAGAADFGQVIVVDGLFLMCHRQTIQQLNGFDSATYKGFHYYDIDTTFRAHQLGLRNYVAPIPMLHESRGKYDEVWDASRKIFVEKHKAALPCSL